MKTNKEFIKKQLNQITEDAINSLKDFSNKAITKMTEYTKQFGDLKVNSAYLGDIEDKWKEPIAIKALTFIKDKGLYYVEYDNKIGKVSDEFDVFGLLNLLEHVTMMLDDKPAVKDETGASPGVWHDC